MPDNQLDLTLTAALHELQVELDMERVRFNGAMVEANSRRARIAELEEAIDDMDNTIRKVLR